MGRTNPTFRMLLEAVKRRWGDYRRALRRRDQSHFDQLFEYADRHADAAGYLNTDDEMDPILFSMLLEQQKRIHRLEDELATLQERAGGESGEGSENSGGGEDGEDGGDGGDGGDGVDGGGNTPTQDGTGGTADTAPLARED